MDIDRQQKPHRNEKITELIHRQVGKAVSKELKGLDALVTVSNVIISPNHQHASVFITVLPYEKSSEMLEALEENVKDIQHSLNKSLRMRPVPKISFKIDDSEQKGREILDLLDKN